MDIVSGGAELKSEKLIHSSHNPDFQDYVIYTEKGQLTKFSKARYLFTPINFVGLLSALPRDLTREITVRERLLTKESRPSSRLSSLVSSLLGDLPLNLTGMGSVRSYK